ncbi:MAG: tetratricopeptide repeat protein [Armatimonadota bacterium]
MQRSTFLLSFIISFFIMSAADCVPVPEASIQWAERLVARTSLKNYRSSECLPQLDLRDAEQGFIGILSKYGSDNGRVWARLADCQTRLGKYDKAVKSYNHALVLLPGHETFRRKLTVAERQLSVTQAALPLLPPGKTILQTLPCAVPSATDLWVVLSATLIEDKEKTWSWPTYTDCQITILKGKPDSLRRLWHSDVLGSRGYTDGEFNAIYLYVEDVTGDSVPDLVILETYIGGSWIPSHIDIFTWRVNSLHHLLGAVSDYAPICKDLDNNSKIEVMIQHAVGCGLSHAEQPIWIDIYAFRNGTFQPANAYFPNKYHNLYWYIRRKLREIPDDYELQYYLGRIYEIQHKSQNALKIYKKAEHNAVEESKIVRSEFPDHRISNTLQNIRDRIRKIESFQIHRNRIKH